MDRPIDLENNLIPLPLAARVVYARVYAKTTPCRDGSFLLERMDGVAAAMSSMARLYTYDPARPDATRPLSQDELRGGLFRNGGREVHFHDGRQPLQNMAISHADLGKVLSALQQTSPQTTSQDSVASHDRSFS